MLPSGWIQGPVTALITLLFIIFLIIKPITKVRMSSNNQACYSICCPINGSAEAHRIVMLL